MSGQRREHACSKRSPIGYDDVVPFREPQIRRRAGSIAYGPFPIRPARVLALIASVIMALALGATSVDEDRLVCVPAATCVVTHRFATDPPPFPASALRDVTVAIERGSKGQRVGAVYLVVDGVGRHRLGRTRPDAAEDVAARIRAALTAEQPIDERITGLWWMGIFALLFIAWGIALVYPSLRGAGRIRLDVVRGGAALRVQRFLFGVPLAVREVSLDGVVDVVVERGDLGEKLLSRGETPTPAGRVVLVDRFGHRRPLTDRLYAGIGPHFRAASALRELLELPPQRGGVEVQLAALPVTTTPLGGRIAYSCIGITVGGLLGLALYTTVGLSLGLFHASDGLDGLAFAVGFGGGAAVGVAVVVHLTRPRPPF